ncbi:MAG: hypothetical protein HOQ46_18430 [Saccharothrix sp.]|nr:hypothetical protein [Saccharothrix sp.]
MQIPPGFTPSAAAQPAVVADAPVVADVVAGAPVVDAPVLGAPVTVDAPVVAAPPVVADPPVWGSVPPVVDPPAVGTPVVGAPDVGMPVISDPPVWGSVPPVVDPPAVGGPVVDAPDVAMPVISDPPAAVAPPAVAPPAVVDAPAAGPAVAPISTVPSAAAPPAAAPVAPTPDAGATVTLPAPATADPGTTKPAGESFAQSAQTDLDKATTALDAVDKESVQLDLDKQGVDDLLKLVSQARSLVDTVHSRAVNNLDVELKFGNNWVSDAISRRLREVAVGNQESAVNVIGDFMQVLFEVEETIRDAARNLERADDEAADAFGSAGEAKG